MTREEPMAPGNAAGIEPNRLRSNGTDILLVRSGAAPVARAIFVGNVDAAKALVLFDRHIDRDRLVTVIAGSLEGQSS